MKIALLLVFSIALVHFCDSGVPYPFEERALAHRANKVARNANPLIPEPFAYAIFILLKQLYLLLNTIIEAINLLVVVLYAVNVLVAALFILICCVLELIYVLCTCDCDGDGDSDGCCNDTSVCQESCPTSSIIIFTRFVSCIILVIGLVLNFGAYVAISSLLTYIAGLICAISAALQVANYAVIETVIQLLLGCDYSVFTKCANTCSTGGDAGCSGSCTTGCDSAQGVFNSKYPCEFCSGTGANCGSFLEGYNKACGTGCGGSLGGAGK